MRARAVKVCAWGHGPVSSDPYFKDDAFANETAGDRVGTLGFYEAIDYTPSRLPRGQSGAVVRSFMAHHQGMSFMALVNFLHDPAAQGAHDHCA